MKDMETAKYDKEEVFKEEIEPILKQLLQACNINRIPMFTCVAVKNTKDATTYKTQVLSPAQYNFNLADNKFTDFINIMNGFQTFYKAGGAESTNAEYEELLELMNESEQRLAQESDDDE